MAEQVAPTKSNLQKSRRLLRVASDGYGLLDRKRNVLLRELLSVLGEAKKAQGEAAAALSSAFEALRAANISLGAELVEKTAAACAEPIDLRARARSVMGAWIPDVGALPGELRAAYSFRGTGASLDEARRRFRSAATAVARAATLEATVIRLAQEIQRTRKRANALHNVLIPRYTEQIKFIVEALEEREREEFFKVKLVKRRKERAQPSPPPAAG
jgi:V/A-type H+-transporting ATPase subunit D